MKRLVKWEDKQMKCALPLPITEDGDIPTGTSLRSTGVPS